MITGASDGMAPAWLHTRSAPPLLGDLLQAFPLDSEPVLVDGGVERAVRSVRMRSERPHSSTSVSRGERRLLLVDPWQRHERGATCRRSLCGGRIWGVTREPSVPVENSSGSLDAELRSWPQGIPAPTRPWYQIGSNET